MSDGDYESLDHQLAELWESDDVWPDPDAEAAFASAWPKETRFRVAGVRAERKPNGDYLVLVMYSDPYHLLPVFSRVSRRLWETQLEEVADDLSRHAEVRLDEVFRDR